MAACDEITEFDRLTLREGVVRGEVKVTLWKEGRHDPDAEPVKARLELLTACGFLERVFVGGTKKHVTGGEFCARYVVSLAGRVAIEALDRVEELEAGLSPPANPPHPASASPALGSSGTSRRPARPR